MDLREEKKTDNSMLINASQMVFSPTHGYQSLPEYSGAHWHAPGYGAPDGFIRLRYSILSAQALVFPLSQTPGSRNYIRMSMLQLRSRGLRLRSIPVQKHCPASPFPRSTLRCRECTGEHSLEVRCVLIVS